ncbi:MAG: GAF domain-containing SpoIIE family protein phosphatase [Leptospirales bacterium]
MSVQELNYSRGGQSNREYGSSNEPSSKDDLQFLSHPDFLKSVRYLIKTVMNLTNASDAHFIMTFGDQRKRIYGLSDNKLEVHEHELIQRCIHGEHPVTIVIDDYIIFQGDQSIKTESSYLVIPLVKNQAHLKGCIFLKDKQFSNKFSDEDIALITTLASLFIRLLNSVQMGKERVDLMIDFSVSLEALTNSLFDTRENLENVKLISEIIRVSKLINSTLDLQNLLEAIMESAKLVLKTEASSLMLIDESTNELYFQIITGAKEQELKEIRIPIGTGIAGIVAETKKPLIVNDAQSDDRVYKQADKHAGFFTRNLIACPLMVRNRIIGVLEVINTTGRAEFSNEDLELFNTFSEQAAIAIHNRELIDSLKKSNKDLTKKLHELSSLHEVSKALISNLNEKSLFDSVVKIVAEELEAKKSSIMLYRENKNVLEIISSYGFPLDEYNSFVKIDSSISGVAFQENRVILSEELDGPLSELRSPHNYASGSCIVYPLAHGDEKYGVINISDKRDGHHFSEDELQLVSIIAGQITKAIENFRLLDEMMQKKAFEKELEITSAIQKSILPNKKITGPEFDIGFLSTPAKVMGGDFYDFNQLSDQEYSLLIADVSGKSLPAALFMAVTSSIIRTLNRGQINSPADLLYQANDMIYQDSQSGMFVTLFLTFFDANTSELRFASAGHNEQLIFRKQSQEYSFLDTKGSPLGVISSDVHGKFGEGKVVLKPGDLVILYTDGVVEAINEVQKEYGLERLKDVIKSMQNEDAEAISNAIYDSVLKYCGEEPQFDDFTLLIMKMKPQDGN